MALSFLAIAAHGLSIRASPCLFNVQPCARCMKLRCCDDEASLEILEARALAALEREAELDARFGDGVGAARERSKLLATLQAYEEAAASTVEPSQAGVESCEAELILGDEEVGGEETVAKQHLLHGPDDRVAVFGGNPARRRAQIAKWMRPYRALDLYGSPHDVGPKDTQRLVNKIEAGGLDVVYFWTRFASHNSRNVIRAACSPPRRVALDAGHAEPRAMFYEVASLRAPEVSWSTSSE